MSDKCEICGGHGDYPIFDQNGTERYSIRCPECGGDGLTEEASIAASERAKWQLKYDAHMAEQRNRERSPT